MIEKLLKLLGIGLDDLDRILRGLEEKVEKIRKRRNYFIRKPDVCVVGVKSAGKSAFLNLILDTNFFASDVGETTKEILKVRIRGVENQNLTNSITTLTGHSGSVYSLSFSPDGKYLASGRILNETVEIWEVGTWKLIETLTGHSGSVFSLSFSPDGKYLASGGHDETIKIWEVGTWKLIETLTGHSDSVLSLSFSPDGKYLASGSVDKTIKIWEVGTWEEIKTLTGHSDNVLSLSFSPDGRYLASGSRDKTIKIWEVGTWKLIETLTGHSGNVYSVSFSPDGKYLASGSNDKTIKIWEVGTWKEIKTLTGHSGEVYSVSFSPDGKYLASGSGDKTIKIWEIRKMESEIIDPTRFSKQGLKLLEFVNVVDVPGYEGTLDEKVENYLKEGTYDIVLYILDTSKGLRKIDAEFLNIIKEREPYILFVLNKIDMFEGEDKDEFLKQINKIKQNVEQVYPKNKILGYVPASAIKFKSDDRFIKFFQNVLIIASYVSTFKYNFNYVYGYLEKTLNEKMDKVSSLYEYYIKSYLSNLKEKLYSMSTEKIVNERDSAIRSLIKSLNKNLEKELSADVEEIKKWVKQKFLENVNFINGMSISYAQILKVSSKKLTESFSNIRIYSVNHLGGISVSSMISSIDSVILGSAFLSNLARGVFGDFVGGLIGAVINVFASAAVESKVNEIKRKVYEEVSIIITSELKYEWSRFCRELRKQIEEQLKEIRKNQEIDNFLNELISGVYKMNEELSKFIIEKFI